MALRLYVNMASLAAPQDTSTTFRHIKNDLSRLSTGVVVQTDPDIQAASESASRTLDELKRDNEQVKQQIADAMRVLETARDGLETLKDAGANLRKIAVLASDSTVTGLERTQLAGRFRQSQQNYSDIVAATQVNGEALFTGAFASRSLRVGAGATDYMTVNIGDMRMENLGQIAELSAASRTSQGTSSATLNLPSPSGIAVNGASITAFSSDSLSRLEPSESALAYVSAINAQSGVTGVSARVSPTGTTQTIDYSSGVGIAGAATMSINGVVVKSATDPGVVVGNDANAQALTNLINAKVTSTGVTASIDTAANTIKLNAIDGRNVDLSFSGQPNLNVFNLTGASSHGAVMYRGAFVLQSESVFSVTGAQAEFLPANSVVQSMDETTSLSMQDVTSAKSARVALETLNRATAAISRTLGRVNSQIEQLQKTAELMNTQSQNIDSASTSVFDALGAAEQVNLIKRIIISDAVATIVGQANSNDMVAFSLLGG